MTDLQFDHNKQDIAEALGIKLNDLRRFCIDIDDYMEGKEKNKHSLALEFVWESDQSFEMKILMTFTLGGMMGAEMNKPHIIGGKLSDLPKELIEKLKRDGLI